MAQESWKREKDETDCKIKEGLILCVNNCGLFGSPTTLNMCVKCYGEYLLKKPNSSPSPPSAPAAAPPPTSLPPPKDPSLSSSAPPPLPTATPPLLPSSSSSSPSPPCTPSKETPAKRPRDPESAIEDRPSKLITTVFRCSSCQKKVGLTGFRCRCGDLFCARHRYSDAHGCSYDYKAAGREAIARENPVSFDSIRATEKQPRQQGNLLKTYAIKNCFCYCFALSILLMGGRDSGALFLKVLANS
ncbi:Zinc finger A20 and AN1 domain-containing stress-associated protein 9 [Nymphaea thermarum]|nr:Zinc finger A20 and AN1 domain-containing stress-associated protein 9 [Nymphaea thermarum]